MNPQTEVNAPGPTLAAIDPPSLALDASKQERRSHGKIAQLSKIWRDRINSMLDDGVPYALIIEKLEQFTDPPLPYPISEMNISRWKDKGYQRHLDQKERLAYVQANREAALDIIASEDTATLPEATLQIIASQYYDLLGDFSAASLKEKLAQDPLKYTRLISVFARLTREILNLKKHREAAAKAAATELKKLDLNRELSDREHEILTQRMDDFFLKPRRRRPDSEHPNTPQPPAPEKSSHHPNHETILDH